MAKPQCICMISLPDEFLKEVDRLAEAECRSRSGLVRQAVREYIENQEKRKNI